MSPIRLIATLALVLAASACSKSQPSGVPDTGSSPVQTPATVDQPAPAADPVEFAAAPKEEAPPPLDSPIPEFEKTGFPDCDDYIENYRQCLNTRLGGDERKAKASELKASANAVVGNIARGVDPARVAMHCKKARALAAKKLEALGCTL